jgi:hypothetical protein
MKNRNNPEGNPVRGAAFQCDLRAKVAKTRNGFWKARAERPFGSEKSESSPGMNKLPVVEPVVSRLRQRYGPDSNRRK